MKAARSATSRPGVALLTALAVVLLLTMFLSELFFATGLELRSLESFKDSAQSRRLARSVLKATEIGLLQDEVEFFRGYRQLQQLLMLSNVPIESGELVALDITPVDGLFNINDIANLKPDTPQNVARFEVFRNLLAQIVIPNQDASLPGTSIQETQASQIYAALMDWLDADDTVSYAPDGTAGAEISAYYGTEPEYQVRNGVLDRLEEMRLVRGFADAHVPWREIEKRFIARAKSTSTHLYAEKLNANLASREEIVDFLTARSITDPTLLNDATFGTVQKELNKYADSALDIAMALVPDDTERPLYNQGSITSTLNGAGVNGNVSSQVFSPISQYYRVNITTAVGEIQARLSALVFVNRNASDRTGKSAEVQQYDLQ